MIEKILSQPDILTNRFKHALHSNKVYDHVVRKILSKEIPLGERLTETQIAKEMEMSTLPVRDAMQRLSQDGWIRRVPYKGAFVADLLSRTGLEQLIKTRQIIESGAALVGASVITDKQLSQMEQLLKDFAVISESSDFEKSFPVEIRFHKLIVSIIGCEKILELYETIIIQFIWLKCFFHHGIEVTSTLHKNHLLIYEAFAARDAALAAQRVSEHILLGNENLLALVQDKA